MGRRSDHRRVRRRAWNESPIDQFDSINTNSHESAFDIPECRDNTTEAGVWMTLSTLLGDDYEGKERDSKAEEASFLQTQQIIHYSSKDVFYLLSVHRFYEPFCL